MPATLTTAAALLTTAYQPGFVSEVSKYSELLSLTDASGRLVFERGATGGNSPTWLVHTTGQTAEIYVEGQPAPAAGYQGTITAAVAPTWFRAMTEYTGHLEASAPAQLVDAMSLEEDMVAQDIASLVNYSFLNASYNGLQVAVDETTTYGGVSRSASPVYFSSYEHALSGALTLAALEDDTEVLEGFTHAGKLGLLLGAPNQLTNYSRLIGVPAAANNSVRVNLGGANGTPLDLGFDFNALSFRGAPWRSLPGMTDTVILGIDTRPGCWFFLTHQPYKVDFQGRSGDANQFHHKIACLILCKRPKRHFKITGVTA